MWSHYFHTLRYLRPAQITGRLMYRLSHPRPDLRPAPARRALTGLWIVPCSRPASLLALEEACFLNRRLRLDFPRGWNDPSIEKLNINRDLQLNLYRILQEQLRNILKYAHCKRIEVDLLHHNNHLKMRVSDDGVGFNVNAVKGGIGISNMRRRTELFEGKFDLLSSPGEGCQLIISIPLKPENLNSKTMQNLSSTSFVQK